MNNEDLKPYLIKKDFFLQYFRNGIRSELSEVVASLSSQFDNISYKEKQKRSTQLLNNKLKKILAELDLRLLTMDNEAPTYERTTTALLIHYAYCVVSIEVRNKIWPYSTIDLARRTGELWEEFMKRLWIYPPETMKILDEQNIDIVELAVTEFKNKLTQYELSSEGYHDLLQEYRRVWSMLGDNLNTKSDYVFETDYEFVVIDFKGTYASNEKGNKERVLTIAKVKEFLSHIQNDMKKYHCVLLVRTISDTGTHNYLQQLQNSGYWDVVIGMSNINSFVSEYIGYDMEEQLIKVYQLDIISDINEETRRYLENTLNSNNESLASSYLNWFSEETVVFEDGLPKQYHYGLFQSETTEQLSIFDMFN